MKNFSVMVYATFILLISGCEDSATVKTETKVETSGLAVVTVSGATRA